MKVTLNNPDIFGALASSLCIVHCLGTPLLFFSQICLTDDGCNSAPMWWQSMDYLFLIISFVAVYRSSKTTNSNKVKTAFWMTWTLLFFCVLNETLDFIYLSKSVMYTTAFLLGGLHLYNLKYCRCESDQCCTKNTHLPFDGL